MYCDPAEPEYIASLQRGAVRAIKGNNARKPGFEWLMTLFTPLNGRVRLKINKQYCPNLINELQLMRYDKKRGEEIVKENDHAVDALRYVCYTMFKENKYHFTLRSDYLKVAQI